MRYAALIDGHAANYGVVVPDLPGCTSGGRTVEETVVNAQEAISLWAEAMIGRGYPVPSPRNLETVLADPETRTAMEEGAALVLVPLGRELQDPVRASD